MPNGRLTMGEARSTMKRKREPTPPLPGTEQLARQPPSKIDTDYSALCAHCEALLEDWSDLLDTERGSPHHEHVLDLEASATGGCALCAQFILSLRGDYLDDFRRLKELGRTTDCSSKGVYVESYGVHDGGAAQNECSTTVSVQRFQLRLYFQCRPMRSKEVDIVDSRRGLDNDAEITSDSSSEGRDTTRSDGSNGESKADGLEELNVGMSVYMVSAGLPGLPPTLRLWPLPDSRRAIPLARQWLDTCRNSHQQCNDHRELYLPTRLVSTKEGACRLFLAEEITDSPEYATLSHCWGKAKFLTLQQSTLSSFRTGIPEAALSQTFRDAMVVARELGFRYIWIDSLCIVQDDAKDWEQEAAAMASVYGYSGLTIAAAGAQDGTFGCFQTSLYPPCCHVPIRMEGHVLRYECVPSGFGTNNLAESPLARRGWVLQERLLSTRILHFTSTQVFWECYQQVCCESFPGGLDSALLSPRYQKRPVARSMWSRIAETYSECQLTYPSDKLPALAGVAHRVQIDTNDQYVAGMWRRGLRTQLCWSAKTYTERRRAAPYRAPSWSWMSLDGPIVPRAPVKPPDGAKRDRVWIEIVDLRIRASSGNLLGRISEASLRLGCSCLIRTASTDFEVWEDGTGEMTIEKHLLQGHLEFDEEGVGDLENALVMPIVARPRSSFHGIDCLVLEPTRRHRGQYQRIGLFTMYYSEQDLDRVSWDRSYAPTPSEVLEMREGEDGTVRYIVDLI